MHSDLVYSIFLGIVEGITEFLPVSSTGHLFLCTAKMGDLLNNEEFTKLFNIFIQIGAIAAVAVYFRQRIVELIRGGSGGARGRTPLEVSMAANSARTDAANQAVGVNRATDHTGAMVDTATPGVNDSIPRPPHWGIAMIILATIPVLIVGLFTSKWTEAHFEKPLPIAIALAVGGVLILLIEMLPLKVTTQRMGSITWQQALGIGVAQILAAVFPGTSRSAATIMAGLVGGLSRAAATEFSFFLAIPAMAAACGYKLLKYLKAHPHIPVQEILLLVIGTLVSFLVAWLVIAGFMNYIRRHNFVPFAIYRIGFAALVYLVLIRGA